MAEPVILSRDVRRSQLPGLDLPRMQIELGESSVYLGDEDFNGPFRIVTGIVSISPTSVAWYDGTTLSMSSLTLTVQAPARSDPQSSHPEFFQKESYDLTLTSRTKRFDPGMWDDDHGQCIQFGSTFTHSTGARCPIALRIPMGACVPGGTRAFFINARATCVRLGPSTYSAPSHFEIYADPCHLTFTQA